MKNGEDKSTVLKFDDNSLAQQLFGPQGDNLKLIETRTGISILAKGGELSLKGDKEMVALVQKALEQFYDLLKRGQPVGIQEFEQGLKLLKDDPLVDLSAVFFNSVVIPARKKMIYPRTLGQKAYLEAILKYDFVFGVGPAGTGKTYLAMAMAVHALLKGQVQRIVLTRPAIEAGEKLGFLPGNLVEKVNPYLRPLYDAMHDMLDFERTQKMLERGEIEVAPLAFMRGRTLNDAFVILDEAQNCTKEQMKMFLTRLGYRSKGVITGDVTQIDLPRDKKSGLIHSLKVLRGIKGIEIHYLTSKDVVRHPLVQHILDAYERDEKGARGLPEEP